MPIKVKVTIEGLDDLARAFDRAGKSLRTEVERAVKKIARRTSDTAKQVARSKGLVDSGELVRSIRPSYQGLQAAVEATATNRGYPYPGRYEFGDRHRPFLAPAAAEEARNAEAAFDRLIQKVIRVAES